MTMNPLERRGASLGPAQDAPAAADYRTALVSLTAVCLVYFFHDQQWSPFYRDQAFQLFALAMTSLVWSLAVFWRDGGLLITPTAAYFLAISVFLGLAGVEVATSQPIEAFPYLPNVVAIAHVGNVVTWFVRGRTPLALARVEQRSPWPAETRRWAWGAGGALLVPAIAVEIGHLAIIQPVALPMAYLGICFLVFAWAVTPAQSVAIASTIVLAGAGFLYLSVFFTGFGRLVFATLALAAGMVLNMVRPRRWHKVLVLVAIVPALLLSAATRLADEDPRALLAQDGSFQQPILLFSELVAGDAGTAPRTFDRQYGRTFAEAAVGWVPRALWADKPDGLGARLALELRPDVAPGWYSMAVIAHGEWYLNFGWVGLGIMALAVGLALARLDRVQHRVLARADTGIDSAFMIIAVAVIGAGLANYVWAGAFTFMQRNGLSFAMLLIAHFVVVSLLRKDSAPAAHRSQATRGVSTSAGL